MSTQLILAFGAGYTVFLAFLLFVVRPKTQKRRIQLLVNSVGLPLTSEIEPTVVANQRREVRVGFLGVVVGIAVASCGLILARVSSPGEIFLIDFTLIVVSVGIALALAAVVHEDRRQKSAVRFARLRAVTIGDYRAPLERWMPRIIVLLALAAFAVRVILTPGTFGISAAFLYLYAVLMVISLAFCEIASRLLLRRGQPAGSALELAWDDALRSRALTSIAVAPFYLGLYFSVAAIALYPSSGSAAAALGVQIEALVTLLCAALLLVTSIRTLGTNARQRFLRRLWPEFAPPTTPASIPARAGS
jgi:hypothetical protein